MLEPKDLTEIMDRRADKIKTEHRLQYIATLNAIGQMLSDKFTYIDAFEQSEAKSDTYTDEEQENLREYFSNW